MVRTTMGSAAAGQSVPKRIWSAVVTSSVGSGELRPGASAARGRGPGALLRHGRLDVGVVCGPRPITVFSPIRQPSVGSAPPQCARISRRPGCRCDSPV
jgi:hypothetical protein